MATAAYSTTTDAERRAWGYWFVDGLPNLAGGLACVLLATALFLAKVREHRPLMIAFAIASIALYGLLLFRMRQTIEWLKARLTYPRTGYAAPPYFTEDETLPVDLTVLTLNGVDARRAADAARLQEDRSHRTWFILGTFVVAMIFVWFVQSEWICLAAGVIFGAGAWLVARKSERASWIEVAGFPFLGYFMFMVHHGTERRTAAFLAGSGLVLMVAGAVQLTRYLRQNPAARG